MGEEVEAPSHLQAVNLVKWVGGRQHRRQYAKCGCLQPQLERRHGMKWEARAG